MFKSIIKISALAIFLSMGLSAQAKVSWTKACWNFLTGKSNSSSEQTSTPKAFVIKLNITYERIVRHNFDEIVSVEEVNSSIKALLANSEAFKGITKKDFKFDVRINKEPMFTEHFYVIAPPSFLTTEQLVLLEEHLSQFKAETRY